MRPPVARLCKAIGHSFSDQRLVDQALTHRSAGGSNNERLEFLGDAILGFVIADELYHRFPKADEGQLSRLRAVLVRGDSLARLARQLDLGDYLHLGEGELRSGGQTRNSILADALEAMFAAVYLDGGYTAARAIILKQFQVQLEGLSLEAQQKDPKTRLQEYLQGRKLPLPDYSIMEVSGEQHDQLFRVKCAVGDLELESIGVGASRRKAEQAAATALLEQLLAETKA